VRGAEEMRLASDLAALAFSLRRSRLASNVAILL
jgi:hypothetical protein